MVTTFTTKNIDEEKIKQIQMGHLSGSSVAFHPEEPDPINDALNELEKNFEFDTFHEERVRKLLENDESLTDDLNHLVIAASLMLSDATQMTNGGLRAYEMGDKIIVEEKEDGSWRTTRTVGIQVAEILAHARAKSRTKEIEERVSGLGGSRTESFEELTKGHSRFGDDANDVIVPSPNIPNPYYTGDGTSSLIGLTHDYGNTADRWMKLDEINK